jgi:hypothetical protein
MTHGRSIILAAAAATALLTAGCGGGDDGGGKAAAAKPASAAAPAPKPLTKSQYLAKADALCRDARAIGTKANTAVRKAFAAKNAKAAADAIDKYGPSFAGKIVALHKLPQPKGDEAELQQLLNLMDTQVKAFVLESTALRKGDQKRLSELAQAQRDAVSAADELGRQYGFQVCGRSG